MRHHQGDHRVTAESRRAFLTALGIGGAIGAGGATLERVRDAVTATPPDDELAPIGRAIEADRSGAIDAAFVADCQEDLASAAGALPRILERETTTGRPGTAFAAVADAARPAYEHLEPTGFFESTTDHLPAFDREYLTTSVETVVAAADLVAALGSPGMADADGVDLLATVVANAERVDERHWATSDALSRRRFERGDLPPTTQAVTGGVVLWFESLDDFLWTNAPLVTDRIRERAAWYGRAMAAGFQLLAEGAKAVGAESDALPPAELAAALSTGVAVQAVAQTLLLPDVAWITDDERAAHRTDLEVVTRPAGENG